MSFYVLYLLLCFVSSQCLLLILYTALILFWKNIEFEWSEFRKCEEGYKNRERAKREQNKEYYAHYICLSIFNYCVCVYDFMNSMNSINLFQFECYWLYVVLILYCAVWFVWDILYCGDLKFISVLYTQSVASDLLYLRVNWFSFRF